MNHLDDKYRKYTGEGLKNFHRKLNLDAYIPSEELIQAVETARLLERPLLLRGEPGSGKTRLAEALVVELHGEDYRSFYFPWPVKSTTKAQDGLYVFDHLERLRDVNAKNEDPTKEKYVKYGPLGEAFLKTHEAREGIPPVLLIDEIDKADIDFPNDLLWELDKKEFFLSELKEADGKPKRIQVKGDRSPIVIITSNDEKDLPNAFLRRCVFHFITFPGKERLIDIVRKRLEGVFKKKFSTDLLDKIVSRFLETRKRLDQTSTAAKPPSTSELLDWAQIVAIYTTQAEWTLDGEMNLQEGDRVRIRPEDVLLKSYDDYRAVLGGKNM
jgi:MoxR-like ATPase